MKPLLAIACVLAAGSILPAQDPKPAPPADAPQDRFERADAPAVAFTLPKAWKAQKSVLPMRLAEFAIPAAEGREGATCTVFWSGEKGMGTVEANIQRWIEQFQTDQKPSTETLTPADGFKAHLVELGGRYVAAVRPGAPEKHDKPEWRLLGAVLETPSGPLYLKTLGPDAVVQAARDDFKAWIKSFRKADAAKKAGG